MRFFALLRMTECHWSTFYESIIIEIEKEKADQIVEKTKSFFEKVTSNIRIVANDEHFINSGIIYKRSHLENLLYKNDYLAEVTFLNEKGKEILKISKYKVYSLSDLRDYSMTEMFRRASKGEIYYGDFYPASDGAPTMVVSIPIEVPQRKITGVLSATIHLRYLWNLLPHTQIGEKGTTYVVNGEGYVIAHPDTKRVTSRLNVRHLPMVDRAIAGEEGIRLFKEKEFDIVLTDLGMPGLSGWEVCRMIKQIRPRTPVGMITGWGMEFGKSKLEEYGLDFLIPKPFEFNQILKAMVETLESKGNLFLS